MIDAGVVVVATSCPACGHAMREFRVVARMFGCVRCAYVSDERDA